MEMEKADKLLGEGHYGKVYLTTHKDYVVKVIDDNPKTIASAQVECQAHASLKHPHIVPIYSYTTWIRPTPGSSAIHIFMPLKKGNLMKLLDIHRSESDESRVKIADRLLHQLIPALIHMAEKNVIHRDIKPENILYEGSNAEDYKFHLSDFGLAKDLDLGSAHSKGRGATGFVAPEMRNPTLAPQGSGLDYWSLFVVILYVVDRNFRKELDEFDKQTDPDKTSMKFPQLVAERIDYWLERETDDAVGKLMSRIFILAGPEPRTRIRAGLYLSRPEHDTFLHDETCRLKAICMAGKCHEGKETGRMACSLRVWMNSQSESPSNRIDRYMKNGDYAKAIPLLRQKMMASQNHQDSLERILSTLQTAKAHLGLNQVDKAVELLEFLLASEVPFAEFFRRHSEQTLAIAYLLAFMNLEARRMKEVIGLKPPTPISRDDIGSEGLAPPDDDSNIGIQQLTALWKVGVRDGEIRLPEWNRLLEDSSVKNDLAQKAFRLLDGVVNDENGILAAADESWLLSQALKQFASALKSGRISYRKNGWGSPSVAMAPSSKDNT